MWLCKLFSFFEFFSIICLMKWNKKSKIAMWKKQIASLFWLDDCAGGICLRERKWKKELLCVLHHDGGIMLPKWRIKRWESSELAALREFQEETGLYHGQLWEKIATIRDRLRWKKITFYWIENTWKHAGFHDEAIMWVELSKAPGKMKHLSERKFIEKYL